MRDLRLIGVHDDGEHLVVIDDSTGEEYRLRIDEPLRAAARRDRPRLGQLQIAIDNDVRPREVQAMIRAGATAEEVSARTGWDPDKIARFEGPVLAEREHVAERARAVRMRGTTPTGDQETLGERARARFAGRGVDSTSVQWDARRDEDGQWTVSATFTAGGRERTATWWFDVPGMSVVPKNDEAKWLAEADAPAGPVPSSVHRPTAVFDVEAEETRAERAHRADPDELIASMREHSGARRRRGSRRRARTPDALPFDTDEETPPAARGPHEKDVASTGAADPTADEMPNPDSDDHAADPASASVRGDDGAALSRDEASTDTEEASDTTTDEDAPSRQAATGEGGDIPDPSGAPAAANGPQDDPEPAADDGGDSPERAQPTKQPSPSEPDEADKPTGKKSKSARSRGRKGRASVPSWDDVMFGTTRD